MKTWIQFVFPVYIWAIAGLIIVATRRSSRMTNLLGNRAVPTLVTLFLLSYMKLLRFAVSALEFSILISTNYTSNSTLVVWSVDGNLSYFGFPHILLSLAGLTTLLFMWLPYTLLLSLIQLLKRFSHYKLLKWIARFHPVYDAYFAPLKPKHQYLFGVLLLARGILLVTFASTFAIPQSVNNFLLLILGTVLLLYMTLVQPCKSVAILVLQTSFIANLTLLSGVISFTYNIDMQGKAGPILQSMAVGLSTGLAFLQFCGIVLYTTISPGCSCERLIKSDKTEVESMANVTGNYSIGYRDSILNESHVQPLL